MGMMYCETLERKVVIICNFCTGWRDGWLGSNGILSTQVAAISCLKNFKVTDYCNVTGYWRKLEEHQLLE